MSEATADSNLALDHLDLLTVLDQLFAFVGVLSTNGVLLEANRSPLEVAGLTRDDVIGLPFWDCPWWNHDTAVQQRLRAAVAAAAAGRPTRYEEQVWVGDGRRLWIDVQLAPIIDDRGTVTMIIASAADIDARARAEAQVAASEARLRAVFNGVDQGFCLCEVIDDDAGRPVDYRFIEVNHLFESMTGLVDATGRTALELVPDLEPFWIETYGQIAAGVDTVRFQQGSIAMGRIFDVCCVPVTPRGHFALVFIDITARERDRAELAAAARRNQFRAQLTDAFRRNVDPLAVQHVAAQLLAEHLDATRVQYADVDDDAAFGAIALDAHDDVTSVAGRHRLDHFGPVVFDDVRVGRTAIVHDVETDPRLDDDHRAATRRLGVGAYVLVPFLFDERLVAVFAVHHGTSRAWTPNEVLLIEETAERTRSAVEWARAEAELRASEARFRMLADALPLPVWVHGPTGAQEWVNLTYCEYFGVSRDEMVSGRWALLTHPDDEHYATEFASCVAEHRPFEAEVRARRGDGRWRTLQSWAQPRFDGAGHFLGHVGASADITERKELEAVERQSRRHAELVAAVIAELEHDDATPRLQRLVDVLVREFADYATVEDPLSPEPLIVVGHRDPSLLDTLRELRQDHRLGVDDPRSVANAVSSGAAMLETIDDAVIAEAAPSGRAAELLRRLAPTSQINVPIELGQKRRGVLTAGLSGPDRESYTDRDVVALTDVANHAGIVVVQSDVRDQDHRISLRLQHALLPQHLAQCDTVDVVARYQPASDVLEVGGDWYDSIALHDGRLLLVVGDVVGHGLDAAAMMGRLRAGLAALAVQHTSPSRLLGLLDEYARTPGGADYTTVFCAVIDPVTGEVSYASAGHPPALVVEPDGVHRWLDDATSPPLCTSPVDPRPEHATVLVPRVDRGSVQRRGHRTPP